MTFEYFKNELGEYVCPYCKAVKKNQTTMHMHYRARHEGTFKHKCKHCTYETSTKQNLDNHTAAKHPEHAEEKPKEYTCPHANCAFKSLKKAGIRSHYLLRHLSDQIKKLMKTEETISCTCCKEEFKSKPAFIYHAVKCLPAEVKQNEEVKVGLGI